MQKTLVCCENMIVDDMPGAQDSYSQLRIQFIF